MSPILLSTQISNYLLLINKNLLQLRCRTIVIPLRAKARLQQIDLETSGPNSLLTSNMLSKQTTLLFLLPFFLHTTSTNAALLLFSNRDVEIPALETFTDDHLKNLLEELNSPRVLAFKVESPSLIEDYHKNRFVGNSAYVPSEKLNCLNATGRFECEGEFL